MRKTGSTTHPRRVLAPLLALLLVGCDESPPVREPESSSPHEMAKPVEFPRLEQVRLTAPEDLAAVAPGGMMRIAVAARSSNRSSNRSSGSSSDRSWGRSWRTGIEFRHARVAGAPDLILGVRTASREPGPAGEAGELQQTASETAGVAADPGRLVVLLPEQGLVAEATTRARLAVYRLTVPAGDELEIRLDWRSSGNNAGTWSAARGRQAINGALTTDAGPALHAAVRFDHSYTEILSEAGVSILRFTPPGGVLQLRFALSTTDLAGARGNLVDGDGLGYEGVLHATRAAWDELLGRVSVVASDTVRVRVATDWYRVLAHYGSLENRDGRFRAADGSLRRTGENQELIGNLELVKEQWAILPLLDLLAPNLVRGLPETLLLHQRVTGEFPRRTAWGWSIDGSADRGDAHTVAASVLAGFVRRSGSSADAERMLPPVIKASRPNRARTGYIPFDAGPSPSVSRTLDASRGAQAVAVIAAAAGDPDTAGAFAAQAVFHRLLFDPDSGVFRGRDRSGRWRQPFPPSLETPEAFEDYTEGRWAEAVWTAALFDIDGLLELLGGRRELRERLDRAFAGGPSVAGLDATRPAMQHAPWLYGFSNTPERIRERLDGIDGFNKETGANAAAWRLFRTLGFYPVLPSDGEYLLVPPEIPEVRLRVQGQALRLEAPRAESGVWRGAVYVDGQPQPGRLMSHQRLVRGGDVSFRKPSGDERARPTRN